MNYTAAGFALALGPTAEAIPRPAWMHFGVGLPDRDAVLALRERVVADGVELVEEFDEPDYVSFKCRDPDGYIVEASWEPAEAAARMDAPAVLEVLDRLDGIGVWVDGGWGVDALLGEATREHRDLDLVVRRDDLDAVRAALGYEHDADALPGLPARCVLRAG